jgi:hypothetical protein
VPPGQRVGTHEAGPSLTGEEAARRCQERTVGDGVARSRGRSTGKDLELVTQDGDLEVPLIGAAKASEQADHPTQEPVQDGREHRRSLSPASPAYQVHWSVTDRISLPNTYSVLRNRVSNVKKSQARIPRAWARRNSDHLGPDRRGEGPRPCHEEGYGCWWRRLGCRVWPARLGSACSPTWGSPARAVGSARGVWIKGREGCRNPIPHAATSY